MFKVNQCFKLDETKTQIVIKKVDGNKVTYSVENYCDRYDEPTIQTDYDVYLKAELKRYGFRQTCLERYYDILNGDISISWYKNGNFRDLSYIKCGEWGGYTRKDIDYVRYLLDRYGIKEVV